MSPTPVSAMALAAVFATEIVSVETPPGTIAAGEKLLPIVTGGAEVRVALPGDVFVTPCVVVTVDAGIVLRKVPAADGVTETVIVQLAAAASDPPESATEPEPASAVTVPPEHVVDAPGVAAIVTFVGSVSLRASAVSAIALVPVLATVIVSVETPLTATVAGENALLTVNGGAIVRVAVAGEPLVEPSLVVTVLAGIVLR